MVNCATGNQLLVVVLVVVLVVALGHDALQLPTTKTHIESYVMTP